DRTGERKWHVAACAMTAAIGLLLAASFAQNVWLLILSFTLSQIGQRSGIGLINAIGNLGGALGPTIIGWLRDATGAYQASLFVLAGVLVLEAILAASLRLPKET